MRRPNRNIEIFSLSVLDLFASALGGFIIIAVILFPYYLKDGELKAEAEKLKKTIVDQDGKLLAAERKRKDDEAEIGKAKAELDDAKDKLDDAKEKLDKARVELAKTFLVIAIEWTVSGADVDLHITDPDGNEFDFANHNRDRRRFAAIPAQLSYDSTSGPGVEIWQHPLASPGRYKVEYVLYSVPSGTDVEVKGNMFERNGRKEFERRTMKRRNERVVAATIVVKDNGDLTVED